MLVSFSVQNFRSYAEKQTFSMVPTRKSPEGFASSTGNVLAPVLLHSACLFGSNGSGKSNLVTAFYFVDNFVNTSARGQDGDKIEVTPFLFDRQYADKPSEFTLVFIVDDHLYEYGFSVDTERVHHEWMNIKPNQKGSRTRKVFERKFDAETNDYDWSINASIVQGSRELWKKSTRKNALFLSVTQQLNAKNAVLSKSFDWIRGSLYIISSARHLSPENSAEMCKDDTQKNLILKLLQAVDIRIKNMKITETPLSITDLENMKIPKEIVERIKKSDATDINQTEIFTMHENVEGQLVEINFREESTGSQVMFNIAGLWSHILENGYTLVIDELQNTLHPHALQYLISLFNNPSENKKNAQLIFTSHETSIMRDEVLTKDQIWLTEKTADESTELIPLSDYNEQRITNYQKAYLNARFGAVPHVSNNA